MSFLLHFGTALTFSKFLRIKIHRYDKVLIAFHLICFWWARRFATFLNWNFSLLYFIRLHIEQIVNRCLTTKNNGRLLEIHKNSHVMFFTLEKFQNFPRKSRALFTQTICCRSCFSSILNLYCFVNVFFMCTLMMYCVLLLRLCIELSCYHACHRDCFPNVPVIWKVVSIFKKHETQYPIVVNPLI